MPHEYRRAGVPRATAERLRAGSLRAQAVLRLCAGCGTPFQDGQSIVSGEVYFAEGLVFYRNCRPCDERIHRDPKAFRQFIGDAYRAFHGAGPDDVAGSA